MAHDLFLGVQGRKSGAHKIVVALGLHREPASALSTKA